MDLAPWTPNDMGMGAIFPGEANVVGQDFHRDGQYLCVASSSNNSITLIDSLAGVEKKKIFVKANGVGHVRYTHHDSCVLLSSDKKNHDIRYLCLYDNRYLRYFKDHKDTVISMSMSPIDDHFLSASIDRNILLWDLSSPQPIGKLQLPTNFEYPKVAYDHAGLVFGVMCRDNITKQHAIKLYDTRNYERGPFDNMAPDKILMESAISSHLESTNKSKMANNLSATQLKDRAVNSIWTGLEFSSDGLKILVNTDSEMVFVLDGFDKTVPPIPLVTRNNNSTNASLGTCFSADSRYVLASSDDHKINIFDKSNGNLEGSLTCYDSIVRRINCNPKYDVIASSNMDTVLWIRKPQKPLRSKVVGNEDVEAMDIVNNE